MFRGTSSISLDAKGRLAMPSRYRDELASRCSGQLVITVGISDPCLNIYPLCEWERIEAQLDSMANMRPEVSRVQRLLIGSAEDVELDSNGRVLVPARLRAHIQLDRQAALVGQLNKFQLWSEPTWQATQEADWLAIKEPGAVSDYLLDLKL